LVLVPPLLVPPLLVPAVLEPPLLEPLVLEPPLLEPLVPPAAPAESPSSPHATDREKALSTSSTGPNVKVLIDSS
jgi:hypothetical protein